MRGEWEWEWKYKAKSLFDDSLSLCIGCCFYYCAGTARNTHQPRKARHFLQQRQEIIAILAIPSARRTYATTTLFVKIAYNKIAAFRHFQLLIDASRHDLNTTPELAFA